MKSFLRQIPLNNVAEAISGYTKRTAQKTQPYKKYFNNDAKICCKFQNVHVKCKKHKEIQHDTSVRQKTTGAPLPLFPILLPSRSKASEIGTNTYQHFVLKLKLRYQKTGGIF